MRWRVQAVLTILGVSGLLVVLLTRQENAPASLTHAASVLSSPVLSSSPRNSPVPRVLLLAYPRSGSSLLGEILSVLPNSTYFFEPLHSFRDKGPFICISYQSNYFDFIYVTSIGAILIVRSGRESGRARWPRSSRATPPSCPRCCTAGRPRCARWSGTGSLRGGGGAASAGRPAPSWSRQFV